jgi:hypothetical protein
MEPYPGLQVPRSEPGTGGSLILPEHPDDPGDARQFMDNLGQAGANAGLTKDSKSLEKDGTVSAR